MAEQASTTFAEKSAALRRGTRNRIAKRRPDFVDPFSLRKKRKTKVEGDELLSALSPCSEEGNLKVRLPPNTQSQDSAEKNHNSSSFEGGATISEVVHSLPTSNPKVRVIIRRKPHPDVPNTASLKLVPTEKPVVKLTLRIKPPQPKLESNLVATSQTNPGRQQVDPVSNSDTKVRKRENGQIRFNALRLKAMRKSPRNKGLLDETSQNSREWQQVDTELTSGIKERKREEGGIRFKALRKSPRNKSPRKVITKVKLLVSPRPVVKRSPPDRQEKSFGGYQDQCQLESSQRPQKKRRNSESLGISEDSHSTQTPTKPLVPIADGTKGTNDNQHHALTEHLKPQLESEPKEDVKETHTVEATKQKSTPTPSSENGKVNEEPKVVTKAPKKSMNLALRANSLPIRKRLYMREGRASSSPVLRRSTRNRQRQGYSR